MTILTTLAILLAISTFATLVYMVVCKDATSRYVSVKRIGIIERDIYQLKRVIVVANQIEKPINTLQDAVEDNFREGVEYLFLISRSKGQVERSRYYRIFEQLARIAANDQESSFTELIQIKSLTYEWLYPPHIFYQYIEKKSNKLHTVCFKGYNGSRRKGIASYYEVISGSEAEPLLQSLLADAPVETEDLFVVNDMFDVTLKANKTALDNLFNRS